MKFWKYFVRMAIPAVQSAAEFYRNQDENEVGQDDLIAVSLDYVAAVLLWLVEGGTGSAPRVPDALRSA